MDLLKRAERHVGERKTIQLPGVTLSIVDLAHERNRVGWHTHENPHFTFILQGDVIEGTKTDVHECSAGDLLFHGRFEPHYNDKLEGDHRCLHLDFAQEHLDRLDAAVPPGIANIRDASIKLLCHKMFQEAMTADDLSEASIHTLSLDILGRLFFKTSKSRPPWVTKLEEILRSDYSEKFSLDALSHELSIHPVHLSRSVSRYFHCTLGDYVRNVRVERSLAFMPHKNLSLTEISSRCGFADQSHFVRSFKRIMGVSPSAYRKLLGR